MEDRTATISTQALWTGRALSGLAVAFLVFDGVIKLMGIEPVVESFLRLGLPAHAAPGIGILELACVLAYVVPRTSAIGAIVLTGFLGGAIAIHVRVEDPLFSHTLFPTYVGAMLWGGLVLRAPALRAVLGLHRAPKPHDHGELARAT